MSADQGAGPPNVLPTEEDRDATCGICEWEGYPKGGCQGHNRDASTETVPELDIPTELPTSPSLGVDRDAGQVRLTEEECDEIIEAIRTLTRKAILAAVERILAARQSDPDATERVEWGVRWNTGAPDMAYADEASARRTHAEIPDYAVAVLRRTVTTGEWTEVGE